MGKKNKNVNKFNDSSTNGSFGSNYRTEYRRRPNENYRNNGRYPNYGNYRHQPHKFKRGNNYKNRRRRNKSRPSSPVLGTQEYMEKKIEQTSAIIMRHLLNPDAVLPVQAEAQKQNNEDSQVPGTEGQVKECEGQSGVQNSSKTKKKLTADEVEEIHMRIMCHISNLNDGRKKNLINSSNSGYDSTIQHFVTQQRLEISRALRNMCSSNQTEESNDLINSMIPDIGIKIEDLSADVIEKLSQTFGCDFNVESLGEYEHNSYPPNTSTFQGSESQESQVLPNTTTDANICSPSTLTMVTSNRVVNDNIVIVVDDDENEIKTEIVDHDVKSDTDKIVDAACVKKEPTDDPLYVGEIKTEPKEEEIVGNREVEHILEETTNNKHLEDTDTVKIKEEPEEIISNDANVVDKMNEVEQENCINTNEDSEMVQIPQLRQLIESTPFEESANVGIPSPVEITRRDIVRCDSSAQTDIEERELTIDSFLERNFQKNPSNFSEAVSRMFLIDEWVARLTKYRQDMLAQFKEPKERENNPESKSISKKRKIDDDAMDAYLNDISAEAEGSNEEECIEEITMNDIDYSATKGITIEFEKVNDVIVEMKNFEDKLVAGSDSGKIYIFDQSDGKLLQQLELPTRVPITSLLLINEQFYTKNMYIGTFRDHLYVYNCHSYQFVKRITVNDSVLCMDDKWEYIFIGCAEGWLQRYSIEKGNIEYEEKFQEGNILSLKAAVEGPRRILIVATEDSPLCVRDAMTFLRLRLIASIESYVAQTINLNKNLIYCTTNDGQLLIMSFHKGAKVKSVKMPGAKGKHCTKFYRNLLFISRNSVVYLYDTKENQFIGNMKGPGGSIVSLNIIRNQLVIGTNKAEFTAIPIN